MNFADYFQRHLGICGGETVLRGTRFTLSTVLASLAEGSSEDHVRAVVAFAAIGC
jgi:uncharacterized protein (DUF433 family)